MINTRFAAAVRFFLDQANYGIVDGRLKYAWKLAKAEERARAIGMTVVWQDEDLEWDGDCPPPNVHACAYISDPEPHRYSCLASLGSIGLESWSDPYMRVVEAELKLEALGVLDDAADKASTAEAEALASRATYAMNI